MLGIAVFVFCMSSYRSAPLGKVETDTIRVVLPVNFPKPVYNFDQNPITKAKFELGKALFYGAVLSSDHSISCSSCHQASAAFANLNTAVSKGVRDCLGDRNAPPLFNLAWQKEFMLDGRIKNILDVPTNALTSPCEMNNQPDSIIKMLKNDSVFPALFEQAFGSNSIKTENVLTALTQFTVMIISADTKYDRYIRKEMGADFTADEQRGYILFKEKCSSCHKEPLFTDGSYRNNGLDDLSKDRGRDSITHLISDRGRFRVPTLRNIEITRPYMHDGRFGSLKQVLQHYASNVRNHANLDPILNKTGSRGIPLSIVEQSQLIAFLKTLTDIHLINDRRFINF
ncbi:cytochrome c peroxidase [Pedobacter westerhofensis]|uniref:Cytochrome c peroxidase n=2 Tax=Pedobacter westerhofensis TaxID=425512 RepID=A0A521B666_9SPHI|nr:cytochrome c peroxidase [Pedobacter westerhofensis]